MAFYFTDYRSPFTAVPAVVSVAGSLLFKRFIRAADLVVLHGAAVLAHRLREVVAAVVLGDEEIVVRLLGIERRIYGSLARVGDGPRRQTGIQISVVRSRRLEILSAQVAVKI
jgi:hypothetical protein